ncbi:hypothetical protein Ga0080559_TMP4811 [Salipiger profundus]|uniref:Uncharacterized protein n=1 Tax=Salipiger profundus TaxID=1229727 RepID=A0A1U7DBQ3_9RHOB|nr:hypothetical protein Ga0080559_TMP4811 [Salipiger profundus]
MRGKASKSDPDGPPLAGAGGPVTEDCARGPQQQGRRGPVAQCGPATSLGSCQRPALAFPRTAPTQASGVDWNCSRCGQIRPVRDASPWHSARHRVRGALLVALTGLNAET